jgi:hypothetical protein
MKILGKECFIYETTNLVFPNLLFLLNNVNNENDLFIIVAKAKEENDLNLKVISFDKENEIYRINLFMLKDDLKHPSFTFDFDVKFKKVKILSFESELTPEIRIDCYTKVDDIVYTNKLAKNDLKILLTDWFRQIKNHLYEEIINKNIKSA